MSGTFILLAGGLLVIIFAVIVAVVSSVVSAVALAAAPGTAWGAAVMASAVGAGGMACSVDVAAGNADGAVCACAASGQSVPSKPAASRQRTMGVDGAKGHKKTGGIRQRLSLHPL